MVLLVCHGTSTCTHAVSLYSSIKFFSVSGSLCSIAWTSLSPFFSSDASRIQPSRHPGSSRPNVATHSWDPSSQPFQVLLGVGWRHRDAPQIRLASVMRFIDICRSCAPNNPNHVRKCSNLTLYGTFSRILHSHKNSSLALRMLRMLAQVQSTVPATWESESRMLLRWSIQQYF